MSLRHAIWYWLFLKEAGAGAFLRDNSTIDEGVTLETQALWFKHQSTILDRKPSISDHWIENEWVKGVRLSLQQLPKVDSGPGAAKKQEHTHPFSSRPDFLFHFKQTGKVHYQFS